MKKSKAANRCSERVDLYFRRKRNGTIPALLLIALVCVLYGLLEGGGGPLYFVAAAMLAVLAVWQFFYTRRAVVPGAEVDRWASRMIGELNIESRALNALPLDIDDFERAEKLYLAGYTTRPLRKVSPLLRVEAENAKGRSSHLLLSCFVLLEESMEVYTLLYSLLDGSEEVACRRWRYGQIGQVRLDHMQVACAVEPAGEEKRSGSFIALSIQAEGSRQRHSYALSEECMEAGQTLLHWIEKKTGEKERQDETKQ